MSQRLEVYVKNMLHAFSPNFASPLANLRNKDVWYLPRCKVAASIRLLPVHDVLVIPFAPFSWSITVIATEPTHANRYVYRPCSRVQLTLPVITSRRCTGIGEPVQHDRVEHLVFAKYLLYITIVMRPVSIFFINPSSLRDR